MLTSPPCVGFPKLQGFKQLFSFEFFLSFFLEAPLASWRRSAEEELPGGEGDGGVGRKELVGTGVADFRGGATPLSLSSLLLIAAVGRGGGGADREVRWFQGLSSGSTFIVQGITSPGRAKSNVPSVRCVKYK